MIVWLDDVLMGCANMDEIRWFFRFGSFNEQSELITVIELYLLSKSDREVMKSYGFTVGDILNNRLIELENYEQYTKEFICRYGERILRNWNRMLGYDYFGQPPRYPHRRGSHLPDHCSCNLPQCFNDRPNDNFSGEIDI